MKPRVRFGLAMVSVLSLSSLGAIHHVPQDFPTIQQAIGFAGAGDTVLVEPGVYVEAIDFLGKGITVGSRYVTTSDTTYVSRTTISGLSTIPSSLVRFESGETRASRLSGFTIRDGTAMQGGAIRCVDSSPTLDHLRVRDNVATLEGGGLYALGGAPLVTECSITDNRVLDPLGDGGGIWAQFSDIVIDRNEIQRNRTGWRGAGIFCEHSFQTISNNVITQNVVDGSEAYYGGGIASRNCAPTITGNYIAENCVEGGGYGGGLFY